jgi:hypothetical protein
MQESTKPYLYYEQIINGLVSIPKRIQTYLSDKILVRNEQHRLELEKQKQSEAERLSLEEENQPSSSGLFQSPLFGWLSENKENTTTPGENESILESAKDSVSEFLEDIEKKDSESNEVGQNEEEDKSSSSEENPSSEDKRNSSLREKCKIRDW